MIPYDELDLEPFAFKEHVMTQVGKYKLIGYVNHIGEIDKGHYTA